MIKFLLFFIVSFPMFIFAQTQIKYSVSKNNNSSYFSSLDAYVNGEKHKLVKFNDELCLTIEKIADFNQDGFDDVLVEIINGCGGNCCGNSYRIYSFDGDNFRETKTVGWDWDGVEIKMNGTEYNFIIDNFSEGIDNVELCNDVTEIYRLNNYSLELIEIHEPQEINAIKEIKASDFKKKDENEKLTIKYDLDEDGKKDKIICSYWDRWGSLFIKIHFNNGLILELSGKRIGILETKTNGVHDIVIGCDRIMKWNGFEYN